MERRFQTVRDARIAPWTRILRDYQNLMASGMLSDMYDNDSDASLLRIAINTVDLELKQHALIR